MAEDEGTTPTPDPNDAEVVDTPASEPGDQEERPDPSEAEYHRRQAHENKLAAEKLNGLMRRFDASSVEELEERMAQPPAASRAPEPRDDDPLAAARQLTRTVAAQEKDPVAAYSLALEEQLKELKDELRQLRTGTSDALTIRDIEDKEERDQTLRHYLKNKHRTDLSGARAEVRSVRLQKRVDELEAKLNSRGRGPDPETRTAPRMPAREAAPVTKGKKPTMTGDEFEAKVEQLRASNDREGVLALQRKARMGLIEVVD